MFRRTAQKYNESPDQKKQRLDRCLKVLKNVDIGKPSAFVGMEVGKPINIDWADAGDPEDTSVDASDNAIEI